MQELDRRARLDGKGLLEAGIVNQLDGTSFAAWMGRSWGQPRDWSIARLGPLEAWQYGSHWEDAMRKRNPTPPATTGKMIELYDVRSGARRWPTWRAERLRPPIPRDTEATMTQGRAWLKEKGIDLIAGAGTDSGDQGIAGYDMVAVKIDNGRFDTVGLQRGARALEQPDREGENSPAVFMSTKRELPVTYAFRTRRFARSAPD